MNCLEANNQRILMLKIESQLYSTTLSTLQGEWNIVLTTKETRRNDFCVCPFPIKRSTTHSKFSVLFYLPQQQQGDGTLNLPQAIMDYYYYYYGLRIICISTPKWRGCGVWLDSEQPDTAYLHWLCDIDVKIKEKEQGTVTTSLSNSYSSQRRDNRFTELTLKLKIRDKP